MRLGIALSQSDSWHFFQDLYEDLTSKYDVEVFRHQPTRFPFSHERINKWHFRKKLGEFLRSHDAVFFEWASGLLAAATQLPKECKIVTRLHSFELYDWAPRINWENVDKVILVSKAMQQRFCDLHPKHAHRTVVVYNGISLEKFKPPTLRDFQCRLGMLCAIDPIKRVYEAVLLLHSLHLHHLPASLHVAGNSSGDLRYSAAIRSLVSRLGLDNYVIFDGFIEDSPTWLQTIDIFISNSFWEGQQTALLEAMAAGVYCLSHNWAGAEEILPLENLYFTEKEVKQKITEYYHSSEVEKRRLQALMRTIAYEKFDVEKTKTQIRQVIDELR